MWQIRVLKESLTHPTPLDIVLSNRFSDENVSISI